jgi:hypothetical protein
MVHWFNAPVNTAKKVQQFLAKKKIQVIPHPHYSTELAPGRALHDPERVKEEVEGVAL